MDIKEKVIKTLDDIRPWIVAHGGNIHLVEITPDNIVKVKLSGACAGCPMSQMTLQFGVEKKLKEIIPEIKKVEAVR